MEAPSGPDFRYVISYLPQTQANTQFFLHANLSTDLSISWNPWTKFHQHIVEGKLAEDFLENAKERVTVNVLKQTTCPRCPPRLHPTKKAGLRDWREVLGSLPGSKYVFIIDMPKTLLYKVYTDFQLTRPTLFFY